MVDLQKEPTSGKSECTTLLNAEYYSSKLRYYLGQQGKFSDVQKVEVVLTYTYDDLTMTFAEPPKGQLLPLASTDSAGFGVCECNNALK